MHPENVSCLTAAYIDCCTVANNHLVDWGIRIFSSAENRRWVFRRMS